MSPVSDEYIKSVIHIIASTLKLKEWNYSKQCFDNIAQNYFGVLIPINLSGNGCDNEVVNIPLVLKLAPTDERFRISGAITTFFSKEIFIYKNILCKYQEIQSSFPTSAQFIMPKCYYVHNDYCKEFLAIQNMCDENYKPFVDCMFLDIDHVTVALIGLAKFHALSYILQKTHGNLYDKCIEFCMPISEKTNKRFMDILLDRLIKACIKFDNTDNALLLQGMKDKCFSIIESVNNSVKGLCLCHGDIWKENILFKYENNMPTSACIIDYQTARICSPAFDVLYLIITSTTSCLRKNHYNYLLDVYYETFGRTLKHANFNSEDIYSREMLDYDLKIVGPKCLIVANTAIWLASGLQEEGHVKSKVVLRTEADKSKAVKQYKDIVSGIIDDLSAYNYLELQ